MAECIEVFDGKVDYTKHTLEIIIERSDKTLPIKGDLIISKFDTGIFMDCSFVESRRVEHDESDLIYLKYSYVYITPRVAKVEKTSEVGSDIVIFTIDHKDYRLSRKKPHHRIIYAGEIPIKDARELWVTLAEEGWEKV